MESSIRKSLLKNFKVLLLVIVLLGVPTLAFSETIAINDTEFELRVLSADVRETVLVLSLGKFERTPLNVQGQIHYLIGLENEGTLIEKGVPALPRITRSLIIPADARMEAKLVEGEFVEYRMPVAPSRGCAFREEYSEVTDYEFSNHYELDEFYPETVVGIGTPYILRDFRGISIDIFPMAYNPQTQVLRVYTHLVLRIFHAGTDARNVKAHCPERCNHFFSEIYENHFLNFPQDRYTPVDEQGRIVVISHSDYLEAIQPYVDWKRQKGIRTDLYDVASVGSTPEDIMSFVQAEYYAGDGLTFVQLVGDAHQVPTYITDPIFWDRYGTSDATYSLVEGDDHYPDLFVGRFSAESVADVETQVERTIHYERDIISGDWLHRGAGIGTIWGEGYGYNGWNGVQSLEVIRLDLLAYHYTAVAQLYEEEGAGGEVIPVEAWEVTEVLHEGIGLLNVDGNADYYYLDTGSYTIAHVHALENDYQLPFIFLAAPWAGNFSYNCFAESWLRATNNETGAPTGAIAVYTSSNALQYAPPQAAMHETVDLLVAEEMSTFGGLMYNGACWMMDVYGAPDEYDTFRNFNILGDASLQVRTNTPEPMAIAHDPSIPLGNTEFQVSTGVANALVCLCEGFSIVASGYADSGGDITLEFDGFNEPTDLTLTVSAYNKITSIETVPVTGGTGVQEDTACRVLEITGINPNPFNPNVSINYYLGKDTEVALEIFNCRGQKIRSIVNGFEEAGSHVATWYGNDENNAEAPSGVYLCRLKVGNIARSSKMVMLR